MNTPEGKPRGGTPSAAPFPCRRCSALSSSRTRCGEGRGEASIPPSLLPSPDPPEAGSQRGSRRGGGRPSGAVPGGTGQGGLRCGAVRWDRHGVPRYRPAFPVRRRRSCPLLAGGLDTSPNTCQGHPRGRGWWQTRPSQPGARRFLPFTPKNHAFGGAGAPRPPRTATPGR